MNMEFKIHDFEGPLDLLLHLIKESKMDIMDIQIEEITEQYVSFIRSQQKLNLDVSSEYLVMAAELIEIKSKNIPEVYKKEINVGIEEFKFWNGEKFDLSVVDGFYNTIPFLTYLIKYDNCKTLKIIIR